MTYLIIGEAIKTTLTLIFLLSSWTAIAATSGSVDLSGVVPNELSISVTATTAASNLNITGGENQTKIATASESSRSLDGYKVFASSDNGSKLVHSNGEASGSTDYTISYDGGSSTALTNPGQAYEVRDSGPQDGLINHESDININVTAYPQAIAGTYSDTITFSIVAN